MMVGYLLVARRLGRLRARLMAHEALATLARSLLRIARRRRRWPSSTSRWRDRRSTPSTPSNILKWPPPGLTLDWFSKAVDNDGAREAFFTSIKAGVAATAIALVLGTLASLAVARHRFFGRETISFLVILPIALPGIVTGVALNNTFTQVLGIDLSLLTVIVGHATFCIVVVYNNVVARLRRLSTLLRGGLGRPRRAHLADLPLRDPARACAAPSSPAPCSPSASPSTRSSSPTSRSAPASRPCRSGSSPTSSAPNQLPIVNVVAVMVILLSIIPVYLAYRLTRDEDGVGAGAAIPVGLGAGEGPRRGSGPVSGSGVARVRVVSRCGRRVQAGPRLQ